MINSMTGYGCSEGSFNDTNYSVEIKTVNNRYLKTKIKLPDSAAFLEEDIDKLLQQKIARGTVSMDLRIRNSAADPLFDINKAVLRSYMDKLLDIRKTTADCSIDVSSLLNLPGVIVPIIPQKEEAEQIRKNVLGVVGQAVEKLKQMRATEGSSLGEDLAKNCSAIKNALGKIESSADECLLAYQKKLKKRVDFLLSDSKVEADEATIAREVAVFAERSDIAEEITRLRSHLDRFIESCSSNEPAGRKLDFITQEMLREANTIASKVSNTSVTNLVVDIKCLIDRIKEQIQNIE